MNARFFLSLQLKRCVLPATLLLLLGAIGVPGQTSNSSEDPTVILGTVAGDKGSNVSVPVYFRAGSTPLKHVAFSVDFISNGVKFAKPSSEGAMSDTDFKISVSAEQLPPDAKGLPRTRIRFAAESQGNGEAKGVPPGLWVFLNFSLAPDAKPFAVSLQPTEATASTVAGNPQQLSVEAGKVIVSAEDEEVIGCFFFTH